MTALPGRWVIPAPPGSSIDCGAAGEQRPAHRLSSQAWGPGSSPRPCACQSPWACAVSHGCFPVSSLEDPSCVLHVCTVPPWWPRPGPGCPKPTSPFPGGCASLTTVTYLGGGVNNSHVVPILEGRPKGSYQRGQGKHKRQPLWDEGSWLRPGSSQGPQFTPKSCRENGLEPEGP